MRRRDLYLAAGAVVTAVAFVFWADHVTVQLANLEGGIEAFYQDAIGRLDDLAATPEGGEDRG